MRYRIIGDVIFHNNEELDIDRLVNEGILVPVDDERMSRAEWEATIKDNPVIDMGDDNLWVMVDLGNPDAAVGEETP